MVTISSDEENCCNVRARQGFILHLLQKVVEMMETRARKGGKRRKEVEEGVAK